MQSSFKKYFYLALTFLSLGGAAVTTISHTSLSFTISGELHRDSNTISDLGKRTDSTSKHSAPKLKIDHRNVK